MEKILMIINIGFKKKKKIELQKILYKRLINMECFGDHSINNLRFKYLNRSEKSLYGNKYTPAKEIYISWSERS